MAVSADDAGAKASYWLFNQLWRRELERKARGEPAKRHSAGRSPVMALRATIHWAHALRFEIDQEHGESPDAQYTHCLEVLRRQAMRRPDAARVPDVFESLFASLSFATTMVTLSRSEHRGAWMFGPAVVIWYYAVYHSLRAMAMARGISPGEQHTTAIRSLGSIRGSLPHPLNMVARYRGAERYDLRFEDYPDTPPHTPKALQDPFAETRDHARGVLLQYLKGTADDLVVKKKRELLGKESFFLERAKKDRNFLTERAKEIRDAALRKKLAEINFLHRAYRYRGKPNYRDAIYLAYGKKAMASQCDGAEQFVGDLAVSARFAFTCGLAYVAAAGQHEEGRAFLADLHEHFRDKDKACQEELFWARFSA